MRRRDFIKVIVGSAAAWPLAAPAQQPEKMHRIGYLTLLSGPSSSTEGFQRGLSQLGYVEGQNVIILYRWAAGRKDRLVDLAKELLQLKVDLFASPTTEAIMAIRSINETIPIVMTSVADPIGNKLVASFARPGGNTTGVTLSSTDLATKRLGLLKEVVPNLSRVAVLVERDHPPTATMIKETQAAAGGMQIELQILEVRSEQIRDAFKSMEKARPDALIVQQTTTFNAYTKEIADLALDARLPSVHENREYVQAGGLIYLSSKSKVIPFVVAIDSLDRVVAAGPAQQAGVADERLVRAALYEWISDLRMVTTDGVTQRKAIDRVYSMIGNGTPAQVQIGEFYSKDPPASRAQRQTVAAEVKAVFSTSDKTYEVEWVETVRSLNGQVLSQENWKGSVTIAVNPPVDERLARINPLGIYVVSVSWSRVL